MATTAVPANAAIPSAPDALYKAPRVAGFDDVPFEVKEDLFRALPPETHHTTSASWEVDEKTLVELYLIWFHTGVLDMIKEVDEGLHMILTEVMEERLEDAGIEL